MKLHVHSAFVYRKTGALLGTTFVLSLHAVFHNVICNWRNCALQFLSIIILGCPLQPCPVYIYMYTYIHTYTVSRPNSHILSRILWIFERTERFCWHGIEDRHTIVFADLSVYSRDTYEYESMPRFPSFASKRITIPSLKFVSIFKGICSLIHIPIV